MPHRAEHRASAMAILIVAAIPLAAPDAGRAQGTALGAVQAAGPDPWILQLRTYVRAIAEHEPGSADQPAQTIGSWSEGNLDAARIDLLVLQSICLRGTGRSPLPAGVISHRESSGIEPGGSRRPPRPGRLARSGARNQPDARARRGAPCRHRDAGDAVPARQRRLLRRATVAGGRRPAGRGRLQQLPLAAGPGTSRRPPAGPVRRSLRHAVVPRHHRASAGADQLLRRASADHAGARAVSRRRFRAVRAGLLPGSALGPARADAGGHEPGHAVVRADVPGRGRVVLPARR